MGINWGKVEDVAGKILDWGSAIADLFKGDKVIHTGKVVNITRVFTLEHGEAAPISMVTFDDLYEVQLKGHQYDVRRDAIYQLKKGKSGLYMKEVK